MKKRNLLSIQKIPSLFLKLVERKLLSIDVWDFCSGFQCFFSDKINLKFRITYNFFVIHSHTHTHMHTHAHICTHMHTHAHTCTHINTQAHTCTHMHTHAHTCTHMHTHAHTCTHMHTHAHPHPHIHTHTCTHMHTQAYMYIFINVCVGHHNTLQNATQHKATQHNNTLALMTGVAFYF